MNLQSLNLGFFVSAVILSFVAGESAYVVQVLDSGQCPDHKDTILTINNVFIDRKGKDDYTLSARVKIREDAYGPLFMGGKAEKCEEGKLDKCTHFGSQIYNDICEELKNTKSFTYDLFNNTFGIVDPGCPFKKGTINIDSREMDVSKFEYIALLGKLWKMYLYFFAADKKTMEGCAYFLMQISPKDSPSRGRNRARNSKKN